MFINLKLKNLKLFQNSKFKIQNFSKKYSIILFYLFRHPKKFWHALPRKSKKWTLRGAVLFFAVAIIGIGAVWLTSNRIQAAWWNDLWQYRKKVDVTNSSTAQTNSQIPLTLDTAALISAGKMQTACGDIRVTDINGKALPYWVHKCNTSGTVIYAWVDNVIAGVSSYYIYYGNRSAAPTEIKTGTDTYPGISCKSIKDHSDSIGDGTYYIDPNAGTKTDSFQAYCDMTTNSGGWTIVTAETGTGQQGLTSNTETAGNPLSWAAYNINQQKKVDLSTVSSESIIKRSGGLWLKADHALFDANLAVASQHAHWAVTLTSSNSTTASGFIGYSNYNNASGGDYGISMSPDAATCSGSTVNGFDHHSTNYYHLNCGCQRQYFYQYGTSYNVDTALGDWVVTNSCGSNGTELGSWYAGMRGTTTPTVTNISAGSPATEEKTTSPVGYWSFDEGYGTTAYDETISRANGSLMSMSTAPSPTSGWQTEEKCLSGKCLGFDGTDDYVSISSNDNTALKNNISTVSTWFKVRGFGANGYAELYSVTSGGNRTGIKINPSSIGMDANGDFYSCEVSTGTISLNTWHHVAVVIDHSGNTFSVYLDGNYKGQDTFTAYSPTATGVNMGANSLTGNGTDFFKGYIDEPKIYNYARTATQIKNDYASGTSGMGKAKEGVNTAIGDRSDKWMTDGLVGWWKMDEVASPAVDSSGNGNSGTWQNSATYAGGKFGNAISLNGASVRQGITAPNNAVLNPGTGGLTLSAWVKTSQTGSVKRIITKRGSSATWYSMYISSGKLSFETAVSYGTYYSSSSGSATINDGVWHHVVMVRDTSQSKVILYVDGKQDLIVGDNTAGQSITNSEIFEIGIWGTETYDSGSYTGLIDDARVYTRALSPLEVSQLANWAPGPQVYYDFNEKSGTTANDRSGNGLTGTLSSTPTWTTGKYGGALAFDRASNDRVYTASTSLFNYEDYTVGFWIKHTDDHDGNYRQIFRKECTSDRCPGVWFSPSYIGYHWKHGPNNDGPTAIGPTGENSDFNLNEWNYITGVKNGTNYKFYVNGKQVGNDYTLAVPMTQGSGILYIGDSSSYAAAGMVLDEFKFYNYPRTQKQVVEDMNAGHPAGGSPVGSEVGYWNLNEGVGTTAYSQVSGGGSGTVRKGGVWINSGKFGKALSLDGSNDYLEVASQTQYKYTGGDFSASIWINPDTGESDGGYMISKPWNGSGEYNYRFVYGSDQKIYLYLSGATGWSTSTTATVPKGSWSHVAFTINGTTKAVNLYINGALAKSATYDITSWVPVYSDGSIALAVGTLYPYGDGAWSDTTYSFKGLIDEVKVYNSTLTADEIKLDMNQGTALSLGDSDASGIGSQQSPAVSCYDIKNKKINAGDGYYWISPSSSVAAFQVYCDMTTDGGGWTRLAKFASTNYSIAGSTYTNGFGAVTDTDYAVQCSKFNGLGLTNITMRVDMGSVKDYFKPTGGADLCQMISESPGTHHLWSSSANGTFTAPTYYGGHLGGSTGTSDGRNYLSFWGGNGANSGCCHNSSNIYNPPVDGATWGRAFNMYIREASLNRGGGSPIAEWKFDEKSGATANDSAGVGYTGAITGATWTQGKIGSALNFAGTSDKVQTSNAILTGIGDFTIESWINRSTSGSGVDYIAGNYGTGGSCPSGMEFYVYGGSGDKLNAYIGGSAVTGATVLNANTWYHVAVTRTGGAVKLYVNGKQDASGTLAASIGGACNFTIGNGPDYTSEKFDGKIDQVQVYNYARTPAQIAWDYNRGAPVGWWRMDEGQGTTVHDETGNNNSGTMTSMDPPNDWVSGKINGALDFDGSDDYVKTTGFNGLSSGGQVSMTAWVKPTTDGSQNIIIDRSAQLRLEINGSNIANSDIGNGSGWCNTTIRGTDTLTSGQWVHLAVTYDNTTAYMYVNGAKVGTPQAFSCTLGNTGDVYIGRYAAGGNEFPGQIDDVRIFNYALSAEQVKQVMNNGAISFK
jgi:hypothetical protein